MASNRKLPDVASSRTMSKLARQASSIDRLTEHFASGLAISNEKGKHKAFSTPSEEQTRSSAMRSINTASQALSTVIHSGWKLSSGKQASVADNVKASAATAAKHLEVLRKLCPDNIDVERAGMSVLGKLLALEMFEDAIGALEKLHLRLCSLHNVSPPTPCPSTRLHLLSIPHSSSSDCTLLMLTSTYLAYALTLLGHFAFTRADLVDLDTFSNALGGTTLLGWIPALSSVSAKQLDPVLTRAYTSLTKLCTSNKKKPEAIFAIRIYAIACLAHTSSGTVEPGIFWDQVVRSCGTFIQSQSHPQEEEAVRVILFAFSDLVNKVEGRNDKDVFVTGKSFITFCEHWLMFAKKAGDVRLVDRIAGLIQGTPLASSSSGRTTRVKARDVVESSKELKEPGEDSDALEASRICAVFVQMTAVFEQRGSDMVERMQKTTQLLSDSNRLGQLLVGRDEDSQRITSKVARALEKMRRAAISVLDINSLPDAHEEVQVMLQAIVQVLHRLCSISQPDPDTLTRTLDTLFVLARTKLKPADPRTYAPAHEYLAKAVTTVQNQAPGVLIDAPNYIRCTSSAFHNLAGTMYQAGRYGNAIGFLKEACELGVKALEMRRMNVSTEREKAEEGWRQLEEQLYRRWELLGVCYSKNGDRKQALEAFIECIKTFPYSTSGFTQRTSEMSPVALFELSSGTKQLGTIVERVTHISACELLMEPTAVSLFSLTMDNHGITGALLERQVDSLVTSRWKEGVPAIIAQLLVDALKVYGPDTPIRRARLLLKCLDFMYHAGPELIASVGSPDSMGREIEGLLQRESFGQDIALAMFCAQYRATTHLWLALHAHRRVDAKQGVLMSHHSDEACKILKTVINGDSEQKIIRKSPPKQPSASRKPLPVPPVSRHRSTRKAIAREPVTPKPKTRKALQPVSLNIVTPPKNFTGNALLIFDDFERLLSLLHLTARVLGLLALVLPKVHILDVSRKLCERQQGVHSDGYVIASVELGHEYVILGKGKRATVLFNQTLDIVTSGKVSDEASARFYLRFAESLALAEDVTRSSNIYCEALALSERFDIEDKTSPLIQRVQTRVKRLEKAATASHVFALIQASMEDIPTSLSGMLQSLRLWNRAIETLARLNPPSAPTPQAKDDSDPFQMPSPNDTPPAESLAGPSKEPRPPKRIFPVRSSMDGLEWCISEGLLKTLFTLSQAYLNRGSAREAEYFAQQAQDLAESINASTMVSRALVKKGEIQLYQGQLEASLESLSKASELLQDIPGIDNVDVHRLHAAYNERMASHMDADKLYEETINMIEELDQAFKQFDSLAFGRKSIGSSPNTAKKIKEIILPEILAAVLRQRIWLLRDNMEDYTAFLNRFLSLPHSPRTKAEENALMAKLTLHTVYERFRGDMFLSSLTESTIALPMGVTSKTGLALSPPTQDILATLDTAEKLYWENLRLIGRRGHVASVRESVVALALVQAFQTSLGRSGVGGPTLAVGLLDASVAITLRREMLEAIQHKFSTDIYDDIEWPIINVEGLSLPRRTRTKSRLSLDSPFNSDDDDFNKDQVSLEEYWNLVKTRYQSYELNPSSLSSTHMVGLPSNWTVVHISVTEDKGTLFITRQEGGNSQRTPLIFCVPLKGRRDNGNGADEEEHLTFEDALNELRDIIRLSDEGTRAAGHIKPDDQKARAAWWKQRGELDARMRELLENIEFCWLGAFKTILHPRPNLTPELISDLRAQFEKVFQQSLHIQDKTKQRPRTHRKTTSHSQSQVPTQITFDDALLECFSTLSPKCKDEELEDLVYFILDLYQFHGIPVAIAEFDVVQVVVDLRAVLEDHAQKKSRRRPQKGQRNPPDRADDEHIFLVLDKNLQGLPWESIPILRGRSVSRIPSVDFLHDRVLFAKLKQKPLGGDTATPPKGAIIDPRKGYYILNPSGDLGRTESRFKEWAKDMEAVGWEGITGHPPSEQQFLNALRDQDLVVYFGHGGGEQYLRSHKIRNLPTCAATMLWGCSSGALREMGDFDRIGTPYNYMLAGCPSLVANLWDVTDRDIDKFCQSVFDKLSMSASGVKQWTRKPRDGQISIVNAVGQSRDSCKLKYLTGAAPIVYGIPFYI